MSEKQFKLKGDQIKDLAGNYGGCIATDMIVVDGLLVGMMYREEPRNEQDSGWRFLSGRESDEYMADNDHHGVYDVNTIANYDPSIIPFLDAPSGSAYERRPDHTQFSPITDWSPE